MIDFIMGHPYLTVWVFLFLMFERAMYCGLVVDDDVWHRRMFEQKKLLRERKIKLLGFIHDAVYGGGLFYLPKWDHLATIILHGINCSLIVHAFGLPVALLYLINPINNQTVLWLNGRRYALNVICVLLAWNFWWMAPVFLPLGLWIHITGAASPLLFLWTPYWPAIPLVGALSWFFGQKWIKARIKSRAEDFKPGNENQVIRWKKIILFVKTIGYQFVNCVLPNKPAMYHDFLYYFSSTKEGTETGYKLNGDFWKGIAVLLFLALDHSFFAFWFFIFIAQWCNVYQVTMNASDRYNCLAGIGAMALVVKYAAMLPFGNYVLVGLAVFYIVKYQPLFMAYRNTENFHLYHIAQQPDIINPRFFLSKIYIARKDPYSAFSVIKQGMRYRPHDFKLMLGFIECMFEMGKPTAGLKAMEICEKYIPYHEEEDCKALFAGIRKQFAKEYAALQRSRDEIDKMTPDQLFDEMEKIKNKTSTLSASKREKVQALYKRVQGVKVGPKK